MKKIIFIFIILALTGCNSAVSDGRTESTTTKTNMIYDTVIDKPEGKYRCFVYAAGYKGGLSCHLLNDSQ